MSYLRARAGLLKRFREGDRDALADVYHAYLPVVKRAALRGFIIKANGARVPGIANADDLADLIQDVFSRAFQREVRLVYDGVRDYAPYLAIVTRNAMVSRMRRTRREMPILDVALLSEQDIVQSEPEVTEPWLDARSLEVTRAYVAKLPEPLRAVHSARYIAALSQRDAAQKLGLSRSKLRKVEDKLRRGLLGLLLGAGLRADAVDLDRHETLTASGRWTRKQRLS